MIYSGASETMHSSPEAPYLLLHETHLVVPPRKPHGAGTLAEKMGADRSIYQRYASGVVLGVPAMGYVDRNGPNIHVMAVVDGHTGLRPSFSELTAAQQDDLSSFIYHHLFGSVREYEHAIVCWNEGGDLHNKCVGANQIKKPSSRSEGQAHMHAVAYVKAAELKIAYDPNKSQSNGGAQEVAYADPKMVEQKCHEVANFFCQQISEGVESEVYLSQTRHGSIFIPLDLGMENGSNDVKKALIQFDSVMKTAWRRCYIDGPHADIGAKDESGKPLGCPQTYGSETASQAALNIPYTTQTYSMALQREKDGQVFLILQPHFFNHSGGMEATGIQITRTESDTCQKPTPIDQERGRIYLRTLLGDGEA